MEDDFEICLCNGNGDIVVIGAMNVESGVVDEFCLPLHRDYDVWAKRMADNKYALCQMTIGDVIEASGGLNANIH